MTGKLYSCKNISEFQNFHEIENGQNNDFAMTKFHNWKNMKRRRKKETILKYMRNPGGGSWACLGAKNKMTKKIAGHKKWNMKEIGKIKTLKMYADPWWAMSRQHELASAAHPSMPAPRCKPPLSPLSLTKIYILNFGYLLMPARRCKPPLSSWPKYIF